MRRPLKNVVRAEARPEPSTDYMNSETYREHFIKKCAEKGVLLRTEEDVDAAIAAGKVLRMNKGVVTRLHLSCGHYVDVGRRKQYTKRLRCHVCQSQSNGELRRAQRSRSWV